MVGFSKNLQRVILPAIVSLAFLTLDGRIGPLSQEFRCVVAAIAVIIVAVNSIRRPTTGRGILAIVAIAVTIGFIIYGPSGSMVLSCFILALVTTSAIQKQNVNGFVLPDGLVQTFLLYLLGRSAIDLWFPIGRPGLEMSKWVSWYIKSSGGGEFNGSFTALGGPSVLLASIYLLFRWRLTGSFSRLFVAAAVPLAWFLTTAGVMPGLNTKPMAIFGRGALNGLSWLGLAFLIDGVLPTAAPEQKNISILNKNGFIFVACVLVTLAGICSVGTALAGPPPARKIVVHNRGGLDWDRPVFGRFGVFSGGMFGLLPIYCRAEGYEFSVIDKDNITPQDLAGSQTLILINSPKAWAGTERQAVVDFVERGGSLLVLGDHTDVFGLMRGFNSLINEFGIRFRFDSAYKGRENWRGCQVAGPDAIACGWDWENPSVAVGASLELSGSARPLLIGRYGFSDAGVRENYVGSYLGNYSYDRGEKLGDVVLAATSTRGRGRVVVWGDTSAFQGGLSTSYAKVVGPMLAWLSRPASWTECPPARILAAGGIITAIAWLWLARATGAETAAVAASLLFGLLVTWALSLPGLDSRVTIARDAFLIDYSHMPAAGHYEAHINPIGPLYTNLFRSGYRVVDQHDWNPQAITHAAGIAFIAPQRSFRQAEVEDLLRAEKAGATVLLAVGQPDSAASHRLLEAHGLALSPRPLGTVTAANALGSVRERENEPRFLDAWPITTIDNGDPATLPGVEVIYRRGDDTVALFRRMGRGGFLVFADTRFFSDMNVEGMAGHWPGNIALIHDVFRRHLGADPDAVRPLFRSPEKPR